MLEYRNPANISGTQWFFPIFMRAPTVARPLVFLVFKLHWCSSSLIREVRASEFAHLLPKEIHFPRMRWSGSQTVWMSAFETSQRYLLPHYLASGSTYDFAQWMVQRFSDSNHFIHLLCTSVDCMQPHHTTFFVLCSLCFHVSLSPVGLKNPNACSQGYIKRKLSAII